MTLDEKYDFLINVIGCEECEISIAIHFNGYNEDTLNELVYCKTGYNSIEQYIECERKTGLQRTPQKLAELKAELEKLENSKLYVEMANRLNKIYYTSICTKINTINEILKANE